MKKSGYTLDFGYKDKRILLNTMTGAIILLDSDAYARYLNDTFHQDEYDNLCSMGFLIDDAKDEKKMIDEARKFAVTTFAPHYRILPTSGCNAKCSYCFEQGMKIEKMSPQTAEATCDFIHNMSKNADQITITWFGGEPLLATDIIDLISKKMLTIYGEKYKMFRINMVTNGSLINQKIAKKMKEEWFLDSVQITMDGFQNDYNSIKKYNNPAIHNFDRIIENIDLLIKQNIYVQLRMNYDGHNKDSILKLIDYIHERYGDNNGSLVGKINLYAFPIWEPGANSGIMKYHSTSKSDPGYLEISEKLLELHDITDKHFLNFKLVNSVCSARNENGFSILPDGSLIKCCEAFSDIVGNIHDGVTNWDKFNSWVSPAIDNMCVNCKLLPLCQGGCRAAYSRKLSRCKLTTNDIEERVRYYVETHLDA